MLPTNYIAVLSEIKASIRLAQYKAIRSVNSELILMYLDLGKKLYEQTKNGWGENIIDNLSADLQKEFAGVKGFSTRNLRRMKMIVSELESQTEILPQLVAEIPWGHLVLLFEKIKDVEHRLFYIYKIQENTWSRATLEENIKFGLHEKFPVQSNFKRVLDGERLIEVSEKFQDEYNLSFLGLSDEHSERQLEDAMVSQITKTLGHFGKDFAFMGRQFRLEVSDKEYFVDLLFYHRKLKSLIAIELKNTEFKPEHSQQLNWYLHLIDKQVKYPGDNPTIGILICRSKDKILVEYALELVNHPIGVASYSYQNLPQEISQYLPSQEDIERIFSDIDQI